MMNVTSGNDSLCRPYGALERVVGSGPTAYAVGYSYVALFEGCTEWMLENVKVRGLPRGNVEAKRKLYW
jgi:hypothetical protein